MAHLLLVVKAILIVVRSALPPFNERVQNEVLTQARAIIENLPPSAYTNNEHWSCAMGNWGDGPQCDEWDSGFSPCYPSAMTISASWDIELMAIWARELAMEFGSGKRGQLGPGLNVARFPWNGRLGEYMSGEDPFFGAQMVGSMVAAYRTTKYNPLQVAKHFIANSIENDRKGITSVVDERTLFEFYYPPFNAAVRSGLSAIMCSYNLVQCTTGLCSGEAAYACTNSDILKKHLKGKMDFQGIVMSDWDATHCQNEGHDHPNPADTVGCQGNQYIDKTTAALSGLDIEMPSCNSFKGGISNTSIARESATRLEFAYAVMGHSYTRNMHGGESGEQVLNVAMRHRHDTSISNEHNGTDAATCSLSPGQDCFGNDIHDEPAQTPQDCCTACSGSPGCTSFTFNEYNAVGQRQGTCYLKNGCDTKKACGTCTAGEMNPPSPSPSPSPPPPPSPPPSPSPSPSLPPSPSPLPSTCPEVWGEGYKSPCKLALANRIIAESAVVLKNAGGVLPLTQADVGSIALIGTEACARDPLAIGGGSGWNGCCNIPKINVKDGIHSLTGTELACPDGADGFPGGNSRAGSADVVLAVLAAPKAGEGSDRSSLQLAAQDVALIRHYAETMNKTVVVTMNAPGPMITSPWDNTVAALLVTWLPGVQNGDGIARALFNSGYEASGRLPFTFPKCRSEACSREDEAASVALGSWLTGDRSYLTYSERGLFGYRYYHAKGLEVSFPFGFGLFAYGSAEVEYTSAQAENTANRTIVVSARLLQKGLKPGADVPQLYVSFPTTIPGPDAAKPEWRLKGFRKIVLQPNVPQVVSFTLTNKDLSYWDDSQGKSDWVCATGTFRACIGANARDAVVSGGGGGACTTFMSPCDNVL